MATKSPRKAAFGDFQTPRPLALAVTRKLKELFGTPQTVVEPTCGVGAFLSSALEVFGSSPSLNGWDVNPSYVADARASLARSGSRGHVLTSANFFDVDWPEILGGQAGSTLVIGNPPWVTTATLGVLGTANVPPKSNAERFDGLDALTGRSNFDISEAMCRELLTASRQRPIAFGLLIKTAVARKVLRHGWNIGLPLRDLGLYEIDAKAHFGASVNACLFVGRTGHRGPQQCLVFADLAAATPKSTIGFVDSALVANSDAHTRTKHLTADPSACSSQPVWRSGIKHDAARVFELRRDHNTYVNGHGEAVDVEDDVVFPMLKSSHVAARQADPDRWMIVPQRHTGDSTEALRETRPKLHHYLETHGERLDARKSRIYTNRPRFSIFGIGDYTFAPWKIAISGLYKKLDFHLVGPDKGGRPVVFDDTVYFLPCENEASARGAHVLLSSELARDFFLSRIFWDEKRPITARLLRQLDLEALHASCVSRPQQS